MSYKKRAKAGWNSDKESSNRSERRYEKEEISEQTKPDNNNLPEGSGQRIGKKVYKYPEEREIKKLTKKLNRERKYLEKYENLQLREDSWSRRRRDSLRSSVPKLEAKLEELQEKLRKKKELE